MFLIKIPITPLIFYTAFFILGIITYTHFSFLFFPLFFLSLIISAALVYTWPAHPDLSVVALAKSERAKASRRVIPIYIFFMLGFCSHLKQERRYQAYANLIYQQPCTLTLEIYDSDKKKHPYLRNIYICKVVEITAQSDTPFDSLRSLRMTGEECTKQLPNKQNINTVILSEVKTESKDHPIKKTYHPSNYFFLIYSSHQLPLTIGQTIKISNAVSAKRAQGDIALYFKKEGIIGNYMGSDLKYELCPYRHSWWHYFHQQRKLLWQEAKKTFKHTTYQLYSLVFLGKKVPGDKKINLVKQHCKSWGISHHLARSGLHLVAFVLIWENILFYLPLVWWLKQMMIILLTGLYFLLSWSSISFIRSCLVFIAYKSSLLLGKQSLSIHVMSLVTLIVLFTNPYTLFFLDFQLSFGITFLLAWINHVQTIKSRKIL